MTLKAFLAWLVVAVVSVVAAVFIIAKQPTASVDPLSREPVFTELRTNPDDVARLTVSSRFDTFTFVRENGQWRSPDKFDYPVDSDDVRALVVKLSDMRFIERKTSNAERFERLEVNDIKDEDSEAVYVRLATLDDRTLAAMIVGRPSARFLDGSVSGTYIRVPDTDEVWLASGAVNVQTRLIPWLERDVVSVSADTVARVVIGSGDDAYEVTRKTEGDVVTYVIPQVPEGREAEGRAAQNLTRGLASVSLEDVRPRDGFEMPEDARQALFETLDGIVVELKLAEIDGKPWVVLDARFAGNAGDGSDDAKAARQRVDEINNRVGGWAYWIPSDVFERLTAPLEKQLKPIKKEGQS